MVQMAEPVHKALMALEAAGHEAYLVGGCVRDLLAGVPLHDYDLATSALPEAVREVFSLDGAAETGLRHGTVTVTLEGIRMEITTYRREGHYSDSRHPDSVVFVESLEEDLRRRDFTVNAMAFHPEKGLVDPFGGRRDLDAGLLRCIGDPDRRFREDGLRLLRAIRLAAQLRFRLEPETEAALFRQKEEILRLSPERIAAELNRMICGPAAGAVLLQYAEILAVAIPELFWVWPTLGEEPCSVYDAITRTAVALDRAPGDPVIRWAVLFRNLPRPSCPVSGGEEPPGDQGTAAAGGELAEAILRRLRFDRATRERVVTLVAACDGPLPGDRAAVRRSLYQLTPAVFFEMLAVRRAETLGQTADYHGRQEAYDQLEAMARQTLEEEGCLSLRNLALSGRDLLSRGYQGREVGIRLAQILDAVLDGKVVNEKEALLTFEEGGGV